MAVRSRRLFGPVTAAPNGVHHTLYTVPVDRTAVVRGFTLLNYSASALTFLQLSIDSGSGPLPFWVFTTVAQGTTHAFPDELVLNPGDTVKMFYEPAGGAPYVLGTGSLLLGAPI